MEVREVEAKTAKAFVAQIALDRRPKLSRFQNLVFRGQANRNWSILPSAFRSTANIFCNGKELAPFGRRTNRDQVEAEFDSIFVLTQELNKLGLYAPTPRLLNFFGTPEWVEFHNAITRGESVWPPTDYHPMLALAQHNGLSTRLIDFTYDPLVAAYFAASGALRREDSSHLAVFEIDLSASCLTRYDFSEVPWELRYRNAPGNRLYQVVKTPTQFNVNMAAQKGLFLVYVHKTFVANEPFSPLSVEQCLAERSSSRCVKHVLANKHAPELLDLLHKRFYSQSSLFPGVRGCVESILEGARLGRSFDLV